jgi:lysozyme family protein
MQANAALALAWILEDEGGAAVRPDGGRVNMGITYQTLVDWRQRKGLRLPIYSDLEHLTVEEASKIYRDRYFAPVHFDELQSGVDYAVVDGAVNLGVKGMALAVQGGIHTPVTGKFDKFTIDGLNGGDPRAVITAVRDSWIEIKRHAPNYGLRGPGWEHRDVRVRERALAMISGAKA